MIGVHGNGLTHELWMPENATLIEVSFKVDCYARYSMLMASTSCFRPGHF